jgi:hypothetical protein
LEEDEMNNRLVNLTGIVLLLCLVLQACGNVTAMPTANAPQPTEPLPATTQPVPTVEAATSTMTQTPVPTPTATSIPEPTKIQHVTKPGEPSFIPEQTNLDCTLGNTTGSNLSGVIPIPPACDNPALSFIERPVITDTKAYLPYLDIGQTHFGGNIDWLFTRVDLYDAVAPKGPGDVYYFFKLDLNLDGRNSNVILLGVKNLPLDTANWTVNGVQAWSDVDGTISTIFDQGVGSDPDLIWARRSPKAIELAFKTAIFSGPIRFAWTAWAYQGTLTPTDIALSSLPSDLYQIDNTCTWGFNVSAYGLTNHCIR